MAEHPQDLELAKRLAAGDEQGFVRFFDEYYPRIYRFALTRLGSDADAADEMAQRTLCRACRKLHLYRGEASLFTWLCQICRHEIHDHAEARDRDARRFVSIDDDPAMRAALESLPADPSVDPAAAASRADAAQLVRVVLDHLPSSYGDALEWKYVEGLEVKEIAIRLAVTALAAESLLARARRAFRDAWLSVTGESLPDALLGESGT
ncbi:MAG TPA: RNA polymerase sigma factor [Steroidobacteraceae bacterium]|nr:RNA polymerase sigma factor [Steroidobacteraceae bacterium]